MINRILPPALAALALAGFTAQANAKEYNQSNMIPADAAASVARVRSDLAGGAGEFGAFEDNCDSLNVGGGSEIIVADQIINVGGHCRIVRRSGGFAPDETPGQTPDDLIAPTDTDEPEIGLDG